MTACRRNEPAGGFLTDREILFVYFYYIYTNIHSLVSPLCSLGNRFQRERQGDSATCKFEVSIVSMVRNVRYMKLPPSFADATDTTLL